MPQSTVDTIAPRSLIVPDGIGAVQKVSGAIWISGASLVFFPHNGSDVPIALT